MSKAPEDWWTSIQVGNWVTADVTRPDLVGGALTVRHEVVAVAGERLTLLEEWSLQGAQVQRDGGWDGRLELDARGIDPFAGAGEAPRGRVVREETLSLRSRSLQVAVVELEPAAVGGPADEQLAWVAKGLPPLFCLVKQSSGGQTLRVVTDYQGPVFGE